MLRFTATLLLLACSSVGVSAELLAKPGDWARYLLRRPSTIHEAKEKVSAGLMVKNITVTVGPLERGMYWWQLDAVKADNSTFAVRVLSELVPMVGAGVDIGRVERYMFKDRDRPFLEYRDKSTGTTLLPKFDFRTALIPCPIPSTLFDGPFATSGHYIGHVIMLEETGSGKSFPETGEVKVLSLDPNLLIGTWASVRDTENRRLPPGVDYHYRPFEQEEYDEMERAGINFFVADGEERAKWVCERPAFYIYAGLSNIFPGPAAFPNVFYRSNFHGTIMYLDEPAAIQIYEQCPHVTDAANLLRQKVHEDYDGSGFYGRRRLATELEKEGISLGTWDLVEWDIPSWENVSQTAYYQLEAGLSGIIQEGKWKIAQYNRALQRIVGAGAEVSVKEMFLLNYAFLRGAARCFNKTWGTSLYGGIDPELYPTAMIMGYEMGARYIYHWTGAEDSHMLYIDQLKLTRMLRDYERAHPRPSLEELRNKAKVAVAFPEGYTYYPYALWRNPDVGYSDHRFDLEMPNELGVSYREVVAAAMWQGIMLARQGIPFDFVVEGEPMRKAGYEKIIVVHRDGTVGGELGSAPPASFDLNVRQLSRLDLASLASAEAKNEEACGQLSVKQAVSYRREPITLGIRVDTKAPIDATISIRLTSAHGASKSKANLHLSPGLSNYEIEIPGSIPPGRYIAEATVTCPSGRLAELKQRVFVSP